MIKLPSIRLAPCSFCTRMKHFTEHFILNHASYGVMNRTRACVHLKKGERRTKSGLGNLVSHETSLAFLLFALARMVYSRSTKIHRTEKPDEAVLAWRTCSAFSCVGMKRSFTEWLQSRCQPTMGPASNPAHFL